MAEPIAELVAKISADTAGLRKGLNEAQQRIDNLSKRTTQASGVMGGFGRKLAGVAAGFIGFAAAVRLARTATRFMVTQTVALDRAMGQVETLTDKTGAAFSQLTSQVQQLSRALPKSADDLGMGLYQTLSSGVTDTAEAMQVLEASSRLAASGLLDTQTAVDAVTTVMNAYGMAAKDVDQVTDSFFTTVKQGKITVAGLAAAVGTAATSAALAGVSVDELGAAIATMTKLGIDANTTTTSLNRLFLSIVDATDETKDAAAELGLEWSTAALKAKGLGQFMIEVAEATDRDADALVSLGLDLRAARSLFVLAGTGAGEFSSILDEMTRKQGATAEAMRKTNATLDAQWKVIKNQLAVEMQQLGTVVIPPLVAALGKLTAAMETPFERVLRLLREAGTQTGALAEIVERQAARMARAELAAAEAKVRVQLEVEGDKGGLSWTRELGNAIAGIDPPQIPVKPKVDVSAMDTEGIRRLIAEYEQSWDNALTRIAAAQQRAGELQTQREIRERTQAVGTMADIEIKEALLNRSLEPLIQQRDAAGEMITLLTSILQLREQIADAAQAEANAMMEAGAGGGLDFAAGAGERARAAEEEAARKAREEAAKLPRAYDLSALSLSELEAAERSFREELEKLELQEPFLRAKDDIEEAADKMRDLERALDAIDAAKLQAILNAQIGTTPLAGQLPGLAKTVTDLGPAMPGPLAATTRVAVGPERSAELQRLLDQFGDGLLDNAENLKQLSRNSTNLAVRLVELEDEGGDAASNFLTDARDWFKDAFDPGVFVGNFLANLASSATSAISGAIMSGLSGLGSAIFGKSPAQRQREAYVEANTQALDNLSDKIRELGAALLSSPLGGIQTAIGETIARAAEEGVDLSERGHRVRREGMREQAFDILREELAKLGLSMADVEQLARDLGLDWQGLATDITNLNEAIAKIDLAALVAGFEGKLSLLRRELDALDITDPAEQIERIQALLVSELQGGLQTLVAGIDFTTPDAGQAIADLISKIKAGDIDLGELGGLDLNTLLDLLGELETLGDSAANASDALDDTTSALRNVPAGFKVALARFNASTAEISQGQKDAMEGATDEPGTGQRTGPVEPASDLAALIESLTSGMQDSFTSVEASQTDLIDALEALTAEISTAANLASYEPLSLGGVSPLTSSVERVLTSMGATIATDGLGTTGTDTQGLVFNVQNLNVTADNVEQLTDEITREAKREARRGGVTRFELAVSPRSVGAR